MAKLEHLVTEEKRHVNNVSHTPPPLQPMDGPPPPYPGGLNCYDDIHEHGDHKLPSNPRTEVAQQPQILTEEDTSTVIFPEVVEHDRTLILANRRNAFKKYITMRLVRKVFGNVLMQLVIAALIIWLT